MISVDAKEIEFDGWHARHKFAAIPQIQALNDKSALNESLGDRVYWKANALPGDE